MPDRDDNFLARWSRRKHEARRAGASISGPEAQPEDETAPERADPSPETTAQHSVSATNASDTSAPALDDIRNVDLSALDASSDYTRFMHKDVPSEIRDKALAKLWTSDPVLSKPEELFDYAGDYTDAAVAVQGGLLRTAYKVGRGFLTDEEVAQWENLGRPAPAQTVSTALAAATILLPGFLVRRGTPADREALREVQIAALMGAEGGGDAIADLAPETDGNAKADAMLELVLDQSTGRNAGFCSFRADEVRALCIHPDFRRRGIGSALLARAEGAITKSGHTIVRLSASAPAAGFFARHGFHRVRERQQPMSDGVALPVIDMQKQVA